MLELDCELDPGAGFLGSTQVRSIFFPSEVDHREFKGTYLAGEAPVHDLFEVEYCGVQEQNGDPWMIPADSQVEGKEQEQREHLSAVLEIIGGGLCALLNSSARSPISPEVLGCLLNSIEAGGDSSGSGLLEQILLQLSREFDHGSRIDEKEMRILADCLTDFIVRNTGKVVGSRQLQDAILAGLSDGAPEFSTKFEAMINAGDNQGPARLKDVPGGSTLCRAILLLILDPDVNRMMDLFEQDESSRPGRLVHSVALFLAGCLSGIMMVPKVRISRQVMLKVSDILVALGTRSSRESIPFVRGKIAVENQGDGFMEIRSGTTLLASLEPVCHPAIASTRKVLGQAGVNHQLASPFKVTISCKDFARAIGMQESDLPESLEVMATDLAENTTVMSANCSAGKKVNWNDRTRKRFIEFLVDSNGQWPIDLVPDLQKKALKVEIRTYMGEPGLPAMKHAVTGLIRFIKRFNAYDWTA
jgi:hypothetical protein